MARSDINYVKVTGKLRATTEKAVRFQPHGQVEAWVPRALLGNHSEFNLRKIKPGGNTTIWVADFKCDEIGWTQSEPSADDAFLIEGD